jgi:hypothetical protein
LSNTGNEIPIPKPFFYGYIIPFKHRLSDYQKPPIILAPFIAYQLFSRLNHTKCIVYNRMIVHLFIRDAPKLFHLFLPNDSLIIT